MRRSRYQLLHSACGQTVEKSVERQACVESGYGRCCQSSKAIRVACHAFVVAASPPDLSALYARPYIPGHSRFALSLGQLYDRQLTNYTVEGGYREFQLGFLG